VSTAESRTHENSNRSAGMQLSAPPRAGTLPQNGAAGSAPRHMTPCVCHCAACRAAGHGNKCVVLRKGLLRLFDSKADVVDLVLRHYHRGASGWDTAGFEEPVVSMQYGPAGDVIAAGDSSGRIHLICAQTGAKFLCLEGHCDFVRCVQFSTDAKQLVSGSDDRTVRLWDVGSGEQLKQFFGHSNPINDVRFSSPPCSFHAVGTLMITTTAFGCGMWERARSSSS